MELSLCIAFALGYHQSLSDGASRDEVAYSATECEDKTLTHKNAIEEVVFGVATNCAMEIVKQWWGHKGGQGRAEDLRQRDATYGHTQEEHKGAGDDACCQPCREAYAKALFPC
jgi:hypothetical protein